jgi:tetratricopeptide (TPR) repeat protein
VFASSAAAQTGGVRGRILDDKGQPLDAVAVKMEFQGGVTLVFDTKTNKKGDFMQIGMRPGSWKFTYTKEGFQVFSSPLRISLGDATVAPDVKMQPATKAASGGGAADDLQVLFGAAVAKLQANDFDGAIAAFDALLAKSPHLPEAHYNKAFALLQKKDYAGAEASARKALEAKSDYGDARVLLSNVYTAQGMKDKALEVMSAASGTEDPRQLFNLGVTLLNSGDGVKAAEAFLKVEKLDPANAEVQYYLATAALNAGKTDECVSRLEKYLGMNPKNEANKATATGLLGALKKK